MLYEQLSFFAAEPKYAVGDPVYLVDLDVVRAGKIDSVWALSDDQYGYSVRFKTKNRSFSCFNDHTRDSHAFNSQREAEAFARSRSGMYTKIQTSALDVKEVYGYEYIRTLDGHPLSCYLAKVGDTQLLWREYMTYTFLETFSNEKQRDAAYKKRKTKLDAENASLSPESRLREKLTNDETLYLCEDGMYATWGYALQRIKQKNMCN